MSQQINLFNPNFLAKKKIFTALNMAQALGLIVVGTVAVATYANMQVSRLTAESIKTSNELTAVSGDLAKVTADLATRQKSPSLQNELQQADQEIASLQQVFNVLRKEDFGNTKGYSEYMKAFARQIVNGVWLTGFSIQGSGNEIGLQGRALQPELVPVYLGRLKSEPALQGKSFSALEMQVPQTSSTEQSGAIVQVKAKPASPSYIEFKLLSSGTEKAQQEVGGAARK